MRDLLIKLGLIRPVPKMFYRLDNIIKYFKILDVNSERIKIIETDFGDSLSFLSFIFYSKLGAVEISLTKCEGDFPNYLKIEYTTYAGTLLFTLKVTKHWVTVEPCMGYDYNVGAKEIDLAIFELEDYLWNEYGDLEVLEEGFLTAERLAQKSHEEQIKFLEKP